MKRNHMCRSRNHKLQPLISCGCILSSASILLLLLSMSISILNIPYYAHSYTIPSISTTRKYTHTRSIRRVPTCTAGCHNNFARSQFHDRLTPRPQWRWRLSYKNGQDVMTEKKKKGKKKRNPYSLGITPVIPKERPEDDGVILDERHLHDHGGRHGGGRDGTNNHSNEIIRLNATKIDANLKSKSLHTPDIDANADADKNDSSDTLHPKSQSTNLNGQGNEEDDDDDDDDDQTTALKKTKTNSLAQTISDSFHFFDDMDNLPKYKSPTPKKKDNDNDNATKVTSSNAKSEKEKDDKKHKKSNKSKKQNDIVSQTISDSFQFLEDNQILQKMGGKGSGSGGDADGGTPKKNDMLAETILNSFRLFDFDDKAESKKIPKQESVSPSLPLILQNATKTPTSTSSSNVNVNFDPSAPLTLADLPQVLNQYGYVRREEVGTMLNNPMKMVNETGSTKSRLAFPQPSTLSNKHLKIGTMISSGFFCLLLSTSIRPNLWLFGAVLGALYGGDIANKAEMQKNAPPPQPTADGAVYYPPPTQVPGGLYGELSLKSGKKIALAYLWVWDWFQGFWFMYRTGQLSYEYYKTYASVDRRFGIQSKVDAWNARFIEGKDNFDKWEQENEVGRKVLAGLRTAWMVEETSYKNQMYIKKKSKYRIVQVGLEILGWYKRLFQLLWGAIRGRSNSDLRELTKGAMMSFRELSLETVSQRLGASVAALVAVNLVGAMFAVAPIFLGLFAIACGIIWPTWVTGATKIFQEVVAEARARGRGKPLANREVTKKKEKLSFVDRNTFSYYVGRDGKKRYYRTGQSFKERQKKVDDVEERTWNFNFFN